MAKNDDDWVRLKKIMVDWIIHHAEINIDLSLASWLDTNGTLLKAYQVFFETILIKFSGEKI